MNDSRLPKPKLRWCQFSLRTLVFVSEANTLSARMFFMHNSAFWSVVLVLAVLTGGCGEGPDTTGPPQEVPPAEKQATASTSLAKKEPTTTEQSPELKVLDHELGNWRQTYNFFKAEWTPKQTQETGTASCTRILGRFTETKLKGDRPAVL
jgi:hypothetical protein